MTPLLRVQDLTIGFRGAPPVVEAVSFDVPRGRTLALVGESGSGKTLTCRAVLRILPGAARLHSGRIAFDGDGGPVEITGLGPRRLRALRGNQIAMIFQEPMRSLSPLHRIGNQVIEPLCLHKRLSGAQARRIALDTFARVGFPDPERAFRSYPFELSGGMRQRAMIAMAMVTRPQLLIADEPTTALDVTTQAQVLGLIRDLQRETGMSVILVTHDLGVVANMADEVVVLHRGRVMEAGSARAVLSGPAHPYTQRLFAAAPAIPPPCAPRPVRPDRDLILEMRGVCKTYEMRAGRFRAPMEVSACRSVDLAVERGRTLAIVGESGSGKTTAARVALGADPPDPGGEIWFRKPGEEPLAVHAMTRAERTAFQREAQMVFQDPYSSLSPRMRIIDALTEPLEIHGIGTRAERRDRAEECLTLVGLGPEMLKRYPHAFSGGQRQRLSIARALTLRPSLLVCDEPTSALDVSVQEQILRLLEDIRDRAGLSYLFISHDLAVVARIADEVAVMRQGLVIEQAPPELLFHDPQHPYTRALIAAQPVPDLGRPIDLEQVARGAGAPESWPEPFRFTPASIPALTETGLRHKVRCHA